MPTPYHNFRTQRGWHFPEDVLALLDPILDLAGTHDDPSAGDPIQYDELRIEHDQGEVEIVVCNRAILLFTTAARKSPIVFTRRRRLVAVPIRGPQSGSVLI